MTFALVAQKIVFDRLTAKLNCRVYDDVPALPAGRPDSDFPYVVIGDDTLRAWDTDDTLGAVVTITLHFWSRYPGRREVKELMGAAYDALNRAELSADGYGVVDCLWDFSNSPPIEGDGKTRHGVMRFRLTIQKLG